MKLEDIALSEMYQRKTDTVQSHLYVKSEKADLPQRVNWWLPGAEVWGSWGDFVKE